MMAIEAPRRDEPTGNGVNVKRVERCWLASSVKRRVVASTSVEILMTRHVRRLMSSKLRGAWKRTRPRGAEVGRLFHLLFSCHRSAEMKNAKKHIFNDKNKTIIFVCNKI